MNQYESVSDIWNHSGNFGWEPLSDRFNLFFEKNCDMFDP